MDTKTYLEQKALGLATLVATGTKEEPTYTFVKKNWNPDTGEQMDDTFTEVKIGDLEAKRDELQKQLEEIYAFLVEIDKISALPI